MGLWAGLVALCVVGLAEVPAWSGGSEQPQVPATTPADVASEPSAEHVLAAHGLVRGWVNQWRDPAALSSSQSTQPPQSIQARVSGVCVTLRLPDGEAVRGTAWEPHGTGSNAPDRPARVVNLLQEATKAAMTVAEPRLGIPNDASRQESLRVIGPLVSVSVELAGPLGVVEPKTWEDAEVSLRPGLDGVAVRRVTSDGSAGAFVAVFPSQMMLANQLPHRALGRAAAEVIGEGGAAAALEEPSQIRSKRGVRMLSFRVAHAAQGSPSGPAMVLYRGQRLISAGSVMTRAELGEMAERLTEHLIRRTQRETLELEENVTIVGRRVLPIAQPGRDPEEISLDTMALVGFALARSGEALNHSSARLSGQETLDGVRARTVGHEPLAFAISALGCGGDCSGKRHAWRSEPADRILKRRKHQGQQILFGAGLDGPAREPFEPNVAGFLAIDVDNPVFPRPPNHTKEREAEYAAHRAELIVTPQLAKLKPETMATAMPSFGWACLHVARARVIERAWRDARPKYKSLLKRISASEGQEVPAAISLRAMRELCWRHQLTPASASPDTLDMIGGIVFTSQGGVRATPYPTWQCVRPLVFLSTMLADVRLTEPSERGGEIVKLMTALRFLRQLEVDGSSAWMYATPGQAIGGIRASTWDNGLPPQATALTLLCVLEAMESLDRIAAANAGQPATGTIGARPRWFEAGLLPPPEASVQQP